MIVYADVLIFLNLIVNYFLLLAVCKIMQTNPKTFRLVLGALLGAVSSLYIFLPTQNFVLEAIFKAFICLVTCLITFGFKNAKSYFKSSMLLCGITVTYGGIMYSIWLLFRPNGMVVNNSVVYFDISLAALIFFTVFGYFGFSVVFKIFSSTAPLAKKCEITIFLNSNSATFDGIVDTGNSIQDLFSMGEIIICDKKSALKLINYEEISGNTALKRRYRLLPCSTVSGMDMLEGVRCDKAEIKYKDRVTVINRPILAFSKTSLGDNQAIINPKTLGGIL